MSCRTTQCWVAALLKPWSADGIGGIEQVTSHPVEFIMKTLDIQNKKYYLIEASEWDKINWALIICNILLVLENMWNISIQLSKLGG